MSYKPWVSLILAATLVGLAGCKGQNRVLSNSSSSTGPSGPAPLPPPTAKYFTTSQTMSASTTAKTLTWDLVSQLTAASPLNAGPDPKFSISVQVVTSTTGNQAYQFSNPTVVGGISAVEAVGIGIEINGVQVATATTYSTLDRFIPASPSSRVLSPTAMVYEVNPSASDTLAITFADLKNTTFAPPTYTQLKNTTTGVFGSVCANCHNSTTLAGGMDISNYNYLIQHLEAVPFDLNDSNIWQKVSTGAMPPGGPALTTTQQAQVHDWILDGAPNN